MYITVKQVREEGIDETLFSNDWVTQRILVAQRYIERVTRMFFEKRTGYVVTLSGDGDKMLFLPVPPISITTVMQNDELVDSNYYQLIMNLGHPDGRFNPKLYRKTGLWKKGVSNIVITGDFGFVDQPGDVTPLLVQELCLRIMKWNLPKIGDDSEGNSSRIISESLRDYSYTLSSPGGSPGQLFGDPKIEGLLSLFTKHLVFAV